MGSEIRDIALIIHFIGLAMGLGTSFAFMFLGMASSKMEKEEGFNFMKKAFVIGRMGDIGIVLLLLSGGYLMTDYWSVLSDNPLLIAKLIGVVLLILFITMININMRKAKQGDTAKYLGKIRPFGMLAMLTAIGIVVLAVMQFH